MKLTLRAAPLPADFKGTPQELFEAMLDRMEVVADDLSSFVIQDLEPGSNVGPWLRNGKRWYVWDNETNPSGQYVPVDISDSLNDEIHVGPEDPATPNTPLGIGEYAEATPPKVAPKIWLQTDAARQNVIGFWYFFGGTLGWVRGPIALTAGSVPLSALKPDADTAKSVLVISDDGKSVTARSCKIARLTDPTEAQAGKVVVVNQTGDGFEYGTVYGRLLQRFVATFGSTSIPSGTFTDNAVGTSGQKVAAIEITPQVSNSIICARYVGQAKSTDNSGWFGVALAICSAKTGESPVPIKVTHPTENDAGGISEVSIEVFFSSPGAGVPITVQLRAASSASDHGGTLEPMNYGVTNKGYFIVEEVTGTLT